MPASSWGRPGPRPRRAAAERRAAGRGARAGGRCWGRRGARRGLSRCSGLRRCRCRSGLCRGPGAGCVLGVRVRVRVGVRPGLRGGDAACGGLGVAGPRCRCRSGDGLGRGGGSGRRGYGLPGGGRARNCLCRNCLRRNPLRGCPRRTLLHRSPYRAPPSRRAGNGVRLGRGVIVGRVVQHRVVAAVVGLAVRDSGGFGLLEALLGLLLSLDVLGRAVRLRGRQSEHRTGARVLSGGTLGRGGQRTPAPSGRRRPVRGDTGVGSPLRAHRVLRTGRTGSRGQRRRQRVLFAALPRAPPGRHGHALRGHRHPLRRHRPAQPRTRGRGPRMLARHDDRALGGAAGRTTGDLVGRALDRARPPAPPPGTTGAGGPTVAGTLDSRPLRRNRDLVGRACRPLLRRTPPPTPGGRSRAIGRGRHGVATGGRVGLPRDLALQEGVHGGPPGPPPAASLVGGLLGKGELGPGHSAGRDRTGPAPDRHLQHERAAAHSRHLVRLQHAAVRAHRSAHDRLMHRVSPAYGPRTSMRTTSPRCAAATTTVLSM